MNIERFLRGVFACALFTPLLRVAEAQQRKPPAASAVIRSAPITNLRYDLTLDSANAAKHTINVAMSFDVAGPGAVLLSLPAWTPGAYEISNFARWVVGFTAAAENSPLKWDKLDYDTWRVQPGRARSVTVSFEYVGDSLDNAMTWTRPDFAFFNGTNLLFYPEGRGFDFPATVTIKTEAAGMWPPA